MELKGQCNHKLRIDERHQDTIKFRKWQQKIALPYDSDVMRWTAGRGELLCELESNDAHRLTASTGDWAVYHPPEPHY
jgi:hypothetical protein